MGDKIIIIDRSPDKKMHWLYFLFIGWWLGFMAICFIFPLFIKGTVAKAFGYW